jgi:poly(hydroxyalkanoate) depolymerase family esterase
MHQHSGDAGSREYWLYVPADYDGSPRPLLVLFHGCAQTAAELSVATQYNRVAATHGFLVAWPQQSLIANGAGCWNWFMAAHQQRGSGEPAIVADLTAEIAASYAIDPQRTYVGGFSAGAAMALVMAAAYPDLYAAAVSVAGCPYGGGCYGVDAAETLVTALLSAMGGYARAMPIFIANGTADAIVQPAASDLVAAQWLGAADLLDDGIANQSVAAEPALITGGAAGGMLFERRLYAADGQTLAEHWVIDDLDHAWCGGSSADTYGHDLGPNLSAESYRFLCEHPMVMP